MQAIRQYPITDWPGIATIESQSDAKILSVQVLDGVPCIFVLLNPEEAPAEIVIHIHPSNEFYKHDELAEDYVGTFQIPSDDPRRATQAFHVFRARPTMSQREREEQAIREAYDDDED